MLGPDARLAVDLATETAQVKNVQYGVTIHVDMPSVSIGVPGQPGPPGPGGGGGTTTTKQYSFASPAQDWVLDHNLGTKTVLVEAFDTQGQQYMVDLEYPTNDQVIVRWFYPMTGLARVTG